MGPGLSRSSTRSAPSLRSSSPSPVTDRPPLRRPARAPGTGAGHGPAGAPAPPLPSPQDADRDIRSKRPPALSLMLRISTIGRVARLVSLLALDFLGVAFAIFTALVLKEAVHGQVTASRDLHGTEQFLPFAYLLTALLFANSGLYSERAQRPGLPRIVGSLFEVAVVALIFAVISGEHFSSFYLFYGSLAFAVFYVSSLRGIYDQATAF